MNKIYNAYISIERDSYKPLIIDLKYWRNIDNARNAIANEFTSKWMLWTYNGDMDKLLQLNISNIVLHNIRETKIPEGYNYNKFVEDIRSGICNSITIDNTEYVFIIDEIKTED